MSQKEFKELFTSARKGDTYALAKLLEQFKPCIIKNSIISGEFDEDCFQELNIQLIKCIYNFTFNPIDMDLKTYLEN